MDEDVCEEFKSYFRHGNSKFIEAGSKGEKGIKPLHCFLQNPNTGKKCRLYELKLKGIPGRIFGIVEKLNGQFVLNFGVLTIEVPNLECS